jgi:hypothetical protein
MYAAIGLSAGQAHPHCNGKMRREDAQLYHWLGIDVDELLVHFYRYDKWRGT